jgi:ABC-2 type transport system ATP-binding protein
MCFWPLRRAKCDLGESLKKGTLEDIFIELSEVEPDTQAAANDEAHESEVEEV